MFGLIREKKIIDSLANELALLQRKADYYYYCCNDIEMSSYLLEKADAIKNYIAKIGLTEEVYNKAYKIYDFRNSGKKDFKPDLNLIKCCT